MPLEVATWINDLVSSNPVGATDTKAEGDDHLRLIKTALKNTFPLAVGARKFRDDTASAAEAGSWTLYRNRTGVANDITNAYILTGNDGAGNETLIARFQGQWIDPTNGSEDTAIRLMLMAAGSEVQSAKFEAAGINFAHPLIGAGRPMTMQVFAASGTWNRPAGCRFVMVDGQGAGGGGGACLGAAAGEAGAAAGGGSGLWGFTNIIDVSGDASRAVVIGAGGVGGSSGGNGGNGGATTITLGGTAYSWNGGLGGDGYTPNTSQNAQSVGGNGGTPSGSNLTGPSSNNGLNGNHNAAGATADGGAGASSFHGRGGLATHRVGAGAAPGSNGSSNGSGGSGGAVVGSSSGAVGGAGGDGLMRVWEFY